MSDVWDAVTFAPGGALDVSCGSERGWGLTPFGYIPGCFALTLSARTVAYDLRLTWDKKQQRRKC